MDAGGNNFDSGKLNVIYIKHTAVYYKIEDSIL